MRRINSKVSFLFVGAICLLSTALFYSCSFDNGLQTLRPRGLGKFYATAQGTWPAESRNPRLAIVWESINGGISVWDVGGAQVDSLNGHLTIEGNFSQLPDTAIGYSNEFLFGKLWVYNDANGDGRFQLSLPAEYESTAAKLSQAKHDFESALAALIASAQSKTDSTMLSNGRQDSFFTEGQSVYHLKGGGREAVRNQDGSGPIWSSQSLIEARNRVLFNPNKWEDFFNQGSHFEARQIGAKSVGSDTLITCHVVRILGNSSQFEEALQQATLKRVWLDSLIKVSKQQIDEILTAPVSSTSEKIIGRSTADNFVYFPVQDKSKKAALDAEKASVFSFAGKDFLQLGFNLVTCDEQRNCAAKNLDATKGSVDLIAIVLADQTTPVFGPVFASPRPFIAEPIAVSVDSSKYTGIFSCQCGATLYSKYEAGSGFWMLFPKFGALKLKVTNDSTYFRDSGGVSIQVRFFFLNREGNISLYKMLGVVLENKSGVIDSSRFYAYMTTPTLTQAADSTLDAASGTFHR